MNILPKKRWHVRTKQNIERVRRDEAKAAEEEKELQRRIKLAEQEARTDLLRKRARYSVKGQDEVREPTNDHQKLEHVNFFKEIEETGRYVGGGNKEYELEKKAEKEKFEKNIGLLTYLGQSSVEAIGKAPWYIQPRKNSAADSDSDEDDTASSKHKAKIDPLNDMKRYLAHKRRGDKEQSSIPIQGGKSLKSKPEKSSKASTKASKSVEQLRAERLQRERIEKERTRQLLKKHKNSAQPEEPVIFDDRQRRYNSQFNPHLARQSLNAAQRKTSDVRNYGYPEL